MFVEIEGIHEVSIVGRKITNVFCELIAFVVLDKGNNKENTERLLRNISDENLILGNVRLNIVLLMHFQEQP